MIAGNESCATQAAMKPTAMIPNAAARLGMRRYSASAQAMNDSLTAKASASRGASDTRTVPRRPVCPACRLSAIAIATTLAA